MNSIQGAGAQLTRPPGRKHWSLQDPPRLGVARHCPKVPLTAGHPHPRDNKRLSMPGSGALGSADRIDPRSDLNATKQSDRQLPARADLQLPSPAQPHLGAALWVLNGGREDVLGGWRGRLLFLPSLLVNGLPAPRPSRALQWLRPRQDPDSRSRGPFPTSPVVPCGTGVRNVPASMGSEPALCIGSSHFCPSLAAFLAPALHGVFLQC